MRFDLKDSEGNVVPIIVKPITQVPLNNTIAFRVMTDFMMKWIKDSVEDESLLQNKSYLSYLIARCISEYTEVDLADIVKIDVTDMLDDNGDLRTHVIEEHLTRMTDEDFDVDYDSQEDSLFKIHAVIMDRIRAYRFVFRDHKNYMFQHDGDVWEIPYLVKTLFSGKKIFSKVNVGQSVEIMQIKKFMRENFPKSKITEENLQDFMDANFTAFLKIIALTVRKWDHLRS